MSTHHSAIIHLQAKNIKEKQVMKFSCCKQDSTVDHKYSLRTTSVFRP